MTKKNLVQQIHSVRNIPGNPNDRAVPSSQDRPCTQAVSMIDSFLEALSATEVVR